MRILVIEDDEASLDLARRVVQGMGHTVMTAGDGLQGLALVRSERPDLVLLDLHLPGIDGFQVVRELRQDKSALPVIAVSAGGAADQVRAMVAGCDGFVLKPYQPEELRAAIRNVAPA